MVSQNKCFVNTFFVKKAKNAKKSSLTCRKSRNPTKQLRETHFLLSGTTSQTRNTRSDT